MSYIIVGLGNPGEEYSETRHNTGRMLLEWFGKAHGAPVLSGVEGGWKVDKKLTADVAKVKVGKQTITLVLPNTFMNNSGKSVKALFPLGVTSGKAEKLLVIYDDLDLPFGKAIKTEKFARIRIGISPITPTGKIRKPSGEEAVTKVILGKFKPDELTQLKKLSKKVNLALETFVTSGLEKARQEFN